MSNENKTMEAQVLNAVRTSIHTAITEELVGYNKPLAKLTEQVVDNHSAEIKETIEGAVSSLLSSSDFREALTKAINEKLAKTLINKIGGEIESKVNDLKRDPVTRAKLTIAIDDVVKELVGKEQS